MKVDTSFVVLNWHNEVETSECIESIKSLAGNFKKQIIVVDNETTQDSYNKLKKIQNIEIVRNKQNLGFVGGVNSSLDSIKGSYIALINNDMVLHSQWLSSAITIFKRHANVCAVGGKEFAWDSKNPVYNEKNDFVSAPIIDPNWGFPQSTSRELAETKVSCLMGGNVLLDARKLKKVGGFDEDFFAYCEETDLFIRLLAQGWSIFYSPNMKVWHKRNLSSNRLPFLKVYLSQRNKLIFIAKHFESKTWVKLVNFAILDNLLTSISGRPGGGKKILKILKPLLSMKERRAYLFAAIWGITHKKYLKKKRDENIKSGQYLDNLPTILRKLQEPTAGV